MSFYRLGGPAHIVISKAIPTRHNRRHAPMHRLGTGALNNKTNGVFHLPRAIDHSLYSPSIATRIKTKTGIAVKSISISDPGARPLSVLSTRNWELGACHTKTDKPFRPRGSMQ